MLILYGLPVSTYTAKVRIALHAKGIAFSEQPPADGYRSDAWRAIVPTGTIPAIDHQGFVLAESEAIIEYLDEAFEGPMLLAGNARERACIRVLARLHDLMVEPAVRALFPLIRDPAQRDALPARIASIEDRLERLEQTRLQFGLGAERGRWIAGSAFSSADCGYAVTLRLARMLLDALGHQLAMPAALVRWIDQSADHPAIVAGLAPWRPATEQWLSQSPGAGR